MSSPEDRSLDALDAPDPRRAASRFLPEKPILRIAPPPVPAAQLTPEPAEEFDLFGPESGLDEDSSIVPIARTAEPELTEEFTLETSAPPSYQRTWIAAAGITALIAAVGLAAFALTPGPAVSESTAAESPVMEIAPAAETTPTEQIVPSDVAPEAPPAELAPAAAPVPILVAPPATVPATERKRDVRPKIASPAKQEEPEAEAPVAPAPTAAPAASEASPWDQAPTGSDRSDGNVWDKPQ